MDNTQCKAVYTNSGSNDADGYEHPVIYNTLNEASVEFSVTRQQSEPRSYEMLYQTNSGEPNLPARNITKSRPNHKRHCILGTVIAVTGLAIIVACCVVPTLVFSKHVESRIQAEMKLFRDSIFGDPAKRPNSSDEAVADLRIVINGTCYCLFTKGKDWYMAREFCLFRRGVSHFAEIRDKETNSFLIPFLKAFAPNQWIWIGGSDLNTAGVFKWNTSQVDVKTFQPTQWDSGQPSHEFSGNPEHCIELRTNHGSVEHWNDNNCDRVKPFLCQSIMTAEGRCGC